MAVGLQESTLPATVLGGMLFGLYTGIFGYTVHVLVHNRQQKDIQVPIKIIAVSVAMYVVSLVYLVACIIRTVTGFLSDDPDAYFNKTQIPVYVLIDAALVAQTLLGDGFLIYRLKLVWYDTPWLPAVMMLCWFGDVVTGVGVLHAEATISQDGSVFIPNSKRWASAFFGMTLATNGISTALITLRLLYVHRRTADYAQGVRTTNLAQVAEIVFESGAIYSATLVAFLGTFLSGSWAQYIVLDMIPPIIGIVFSIIIIRVHLRTTSPGWATRSTNTAFTSPRSRSQHILSLVPHQLDGQKEGEADLPMEGITIKVDKTTTGPVDYAPGSTDHGESM